MMQEHNEQLRGLLLAISLLDDVTGRVNRGGATHLSRYD